MSVVTDPAAGAPGACACARPGTTSHSAMPRPALTCRAVMRMVGSLSKSAWPPSDCCRHAYGQVARFFPAPGTFATPASLEATMDVFRQDLLFALRVLRRDRAYAAAVILTLAICLGANTAIFAVVRSVLQRPLPYPESSRLVSSFDGFPGAGVERAGTSVPNYMDRRGMTDVFSAVALYQFSGLKV